MTMPVRTATPIVSKLNSFFAMTMELSQGSGGRQLRLCGNGNISQEEPTLIIPGQN